MLALITGGSSGIGLELAKLFAKDGYDLLLISKPVAELQAAKALLESSFPAVDVKIMAKDLSVLEHSTEIYNWVKANNIVVDVLINNAGFGSYGFINDIPIAYEVNMLQLNIINTYMLTRLFLKDMVKRNQGNIINISSISGFQPSPSLSTYAASKAFVYQFSRAANYELKAKKSKVTITTVCPTAVRTKFQATANMGDSTLFNSWMSTTPDQVAKSAYKAMKKGKDFIVPKWYYHWLQKIVNRMPTRLLIWYSAYALRPRR